MDVLEISPQEVQKLFPLCRKQPGCLDFVHHSFINVTSSVHIHYTTLLIGVDDILAGFYVKDDGRVNPVDATMALAKGIYLSGIAHRYICAL